MLSLLSSCRLGSQSLPEKPASLPLRLDEDRSATFGGEKIPLFASKIIQQGPTLHLLTLREGLWHLGPSGLRPEADLPKSPVTQTPRPFYGWWPADAAEGRPAFAITKARVYGNAGAGWKDLSAQGIRGGTRFSSLAFYKGSLWVGSTFNGVYRTTRSDPYKVVSPGVLSENPGWAPAREGLPKAQYSWEEYFWDEIADLFVSDGALWCRSIPGGRLWLWSSNSWVPVAQPEEILSVIHDVQGGRCHLIGKSKSYFPIADVKPALQAEPLPVSGQTVFENGSFTSVGQFSRVFPYKQRRPERPSNAIRSLFVNLDYISDSQLDLVCRYLKNGWANSLVVNFKDDTGNLIWGPNLPKAREVGSAMTHHRLAGFLQKIRPYRPWLVARMVVFKDFRLHQYQGGRLAIWDSVKNTPWRVNDIEYWVDPYSQEVLEYNLAAARELASRAPEFGLREIQFDYIRLPSDPEVSRAQFRHRKAGFERHDALEAFVHGIRDLPILTSVDVYGYKAFYRMGNVIGQDLETLSEGMDVVCPMLYPSHFGDSFLQDGPDPRELRVVQTGVARASQMLWEGTSVRPWLQAFSWRAKDYGPRYIQNQIQGVGTVQGASWGLWNPVGDYEILAQTWIP
ncbi:MAG: hypothetical protein J0L75_09795 [Spirochaetes bacterium]|nr:hypothetical protein [Spirochaetota bacterium]